MMECSEYKTKFKALFDKLLHNKFELSAKQSENLLKYLDGSQDRDKSVAKILETPFFANLLVYAIKHSEFASTSVKIFLSKLVSIVLSNEVLFNRFVHLQGFELLLGRIDAEKTLETPVELKLAITQQLMAFIGHYSGVKYVTETKIYRRLFNNTKPPAITEVMVEFMSKFIWKLNEYEEEAALIEALEYVLKPLLGYCLTEPTTEVESHDVQPVSVIQFVQVLVKILGEVEHLAEPNNVVPVLTRVFSIESKLTTALVKTQDLVLARLLAEAALRYYYATSRQMVLLRPDTETRVNQEFHEASNKIMYTLIKKRSYETILEFLRQCHAFWHKVDRNGTDVGFEKFGKNFIFQNHFIIPLLMPLFVKQKMVKRLVCDPMMEDATEKFHSDLAKKFPYDMIRMVYNLRDLIMESTGDNLSAASTCALQKFLQLKGLLSRQQASMVFQTLFYALNEFVLSDGSDLVLLANPLRTPDDEQFLEHILYALVMLLDEHEINWHETLEVVELQAVLMNLIKQNILPVKLLVQALELVTTCVSRLLSPELSLLTEPRRGGSLREAAGAARALLQRPESDVRFATLQLIRSFLAVACVKFTPLRAVISSHGLLTGAACYAFNCEDTRAQAAALRCLATAACCEDLWTELLEHCQNLYEQLLTILRCSLEGDVRKQAASVLLHVYIHRKVSEAFTRRVSRAMARAATEDPHWPVQLTALTFWKEVAKKQLCDRGWIDGTFPSVTFCKEKRKIIVLNYREIHKQLDVVMGNLSKTGCLAVLVKCMNSRSSEVVEQTFKITDRIIEALDHYKYGVISSPAQSPTSVASPSMYTDDQHDKARSLRPAPLELNTDIISEILECLSTASSESECSDPIEIIPPSDFIDKVRTETKRRPSKVGLGTLIDELVAL